MSEWVSVYAYIMVVVLFPLQMTPVMVILASAALGMLADVYSGMLAITSISMVFIGYLRSFVMKFILPAELLVAGGIPFARRIGRGYFLRYSFVMSLLYVSLYTMLDVMTIEHIGVTISRIAISTIATTFLIYVLQMPLRAK